MKGEHRHTFDRMVSHVILTGIVRYYNLASIGLEIILVLESNFECIQRSTN